MIGIISNASHRFFNLKKAGKMRTLGFRPKVRGVAMILVIIRMVAARVKNHHQ